LVGAKYIGGNGVPFRLGYEKSHYHVFLVWQGGLGGEKHGFIELQIICFGEIFLDLRFLHFA
jgi:hypothetical protein